MGTFVCWDVCWFVVCFNGNYRKISGTYCSTRMQQQWITVEGMSWCNSEISILILCVLIFLQLSFISSGPETVTFSECTVAPLINKTWIESKKMF